jgi:AraC-like DNA-binding protein
MLVARLDMPRSTRFPTHSHDQHQLVWAASGVLVVEIGDEHWTLPPNLALWVPAGRPHAVAATRPSAMMGVYLLPSRYPDRWSAPTLFAVSPLLHELLLHLADPELEAVARLRAERVVLDLLRPVTMTRIHLAMPVDPRARAVADALVSCPADDRSLECWGAEVGASTRTLSRLFVGETGMSFAQWRTQLRLRAALPWLAAGTPVGSVARAVGYDTPSGYVAAFRRTTGRTPAAYFAPSAD